MSILKKLLMVVVFVCATLVLPSLILIGFVNAESNFSVYVIVYGVILFSIFGYIIVSVKSMSKELHDAVEEMKKQNAAIAYKLTSADFDVDNSSDITEKNLEHAVVTEDEKQKKINLNPADDFVAEAVSSSANNDIDDFE